MHHHPVALFLRYARVKVPLVDESTRTDSQYGGVVAYTKNEADTVTASKGKWSLLSLSPKTVNVQMYATDELLESGAEDYLMTAASIANRRKLDSLLIRGTGSGEPLGLINADCTITATAVSAASSLIAEDLAAAAQHFHGPGWSSRSSVILFNPDLMSVLPLLEFSGGDGNAPMWRWKSESERFNTLLGLPAIPCEACSPVGTSGDLIIADLSQYLICERRVQKIISMHVHFTTDESTLKLNYRLDGAPLWARAVTPEQSTVKVSPFVIIGDR